MTPLRKNGQPTVATRDAWQAALAAEQRARFGYGVLGPQLAAPTLELARAAQSAHEELIATTSAAMSAAGVAPNPPAADYPDLYPVNSATAAKALAIRLEDAAARAWRFAYATAAGNSSAGQPSAGAPANPIERSVLTLAQRALIDSAVRETQWRLQLGTGTPTVPFPGI